MKKLPHGKAILFATVVVALFTAGCVVRERTYVRPAPVGAEVSVGGEVDVTGPPPPPIVETVTVAPDPSFVWIDGVYVWGGGGWRWERGHWAARPHPGAVWVQPRYVYRRGRHVWVRGGWR